LINGKKVDIPSYQVKINDVISIKEKSRKLECFQESIRNSMPPPYLEVNKSDFSAKLAYVPTRDETQTQCEVSLVVEYYSR
jgi:small subunit ribosomal protein S4